MATTAAPTQAAQPSSATKSTLPMPTAAIITAMVKFNSRVSDLIISPFRPPQVEVSGQLVPVAGLPVLTANDTAQIAAELISTNRRAADFLKNDGACDTSYSIPDIARFRVNVFRQRGTYAIVMRIIPMTIPSFDDLKLPPQLRQIAELKNGICLVTGPTGSGKSSTLAAIIRLINETKAYHIVTIEDPIEFMHPHGKSTIHQRELHSDTPTFALALRAALRQAPKVILVGEMRDRETIEIAMTASETGHLVFSTLHTIDAPKTVERIIGEFPVAEQTAIRNRLSQSFRYIISQRLLPRKDGHGRVAAMEILKSTMRTRDYVQNGEKDGQSLHDAMADGELEGMQHFDAVLEKFTREGVISKTTAVGFATNAGNLTLSLSDYEEPLEPAPEKPAGA